MSALNLLKGISGEFEVGRVLLAGGGLAAIVAPIGFVAWDMAKGAHFDVAAFCLAYPGGLGAMLASGVISIGGKDKSVAIARQTIARPPLDDKGAGA